ncbi:MAG: addiction module protein [Planctomycetia bacterium]
MSPSAESLLVSALSLSEADRLHLAEALLAASDPPAPALQGDAWLRDIQRRSAEVDRGVPACVAWEDAKQRARASSAE